MRLLALCIVAGLFASPASSASLKDRLDQVEPGMQKSDVIDLLGKPRSRSFRGSAEALQYCSTGAFTNSLATIWLVRGAVVSLTTSKERSNASCSSQLFEVFFGQIPPDVRIEIEKR